MALKLTNKHDLPETFVRAVMVDKHRVHGDISVTQLIDAPQPRQLRRSNDIEEDVMDRVYAIVGTAMHHILELSDINGKEARLFMETAAILREHGEDKGADWLLKMCNEKYPDAIDDNVMLETTLTTKINGMVVSGTMDRFDKKTGSLLDYKNCSVYAYIYPESKKKWYAQLNIYAYMLRELGHEVKEIHVMAIFRDWSAMNKLRNRDYPEHQVMKIAIKMQTQEFMYKYIHDRVALHKAADLGDIAPCTGKDRWSTADKFAIRRPDYKKAVKIFDKEAFAEDYIKLNKNRYPGAYIEFRPGEDKRCEKFCPVAKFCPQRKERLRLIAKNAEDGEIK